MRGWNAPKMTREDRTLWQRAADDSEAVTALLYSLLKFTVELRMPPDGMKGLQEAIKAAHERADDPELSEALATLLKMTEP